MPKRKKISKKRVKKIKKNKNLVTVYEPKIPFTLPPEPKKTFPTGIVILSAGLVLIFIYLLGGCYFKSEEKKIAEKYNKIKMCVSADFSNLKEKMKISESQFNSLKIVLNTRDISDDTLWIKKNISWAKAKTIQQTLTDFNIDYNQKTDDLNILKMSHDKITKTFPSMIYFYNIKLFTGVTNESNRIN